MLEALSQPYLQNALAAGAIAACIAAVVGYFVVLRGVAFAAHALAQIGFAGAAGAVLVGIDPLWGLVGFALLGALGIGRLNPSTRGSDVTTALVLVASLGTGALFLALNTSFATQAFTLLFGTIVGVSRTQALATLALALTCAFALAFIARPLLFATVSPDVASVRGVRLGLINVGFLAILGVVAAVTVPTVGTLLIYSLLVGPAAAAAQITTRPIATIVTAIALGECATLAGIGLAYASGWPVGFFISSIVAVEYGTGRLVAHARQNRLTASQ